MPENFARQIFLQHRCGDDVKVGAGQVGLERADFMRLERERDLAGIQEVWLETQALEHWQAGIVSTGAIGEG